MVYISNLYSTTLFPCPSTSDFPPLSSFNPPSPQLSFPESPIPDWIAVVIPLKYLGTSTVECLLRLEQTDHQLQLSQNNTSQEDCFIILLVASSGLNIRNISTFKSPLRSIASVVTLLSFRTNTITSDYNRPSHHRRKSGRRSIKVDVVGSAGVSTILDFQQAYRLSFGRCWIHCLQH